MVCAESGTFDELEKIAGQREAKGVFIDRGAHRQERKITRWLSGVEEWRRRNLHSESSVPSR